MASFSLDRFRSEILRGSGLARTNRFEVIIPPPSGLSNRTSDATLVSLYVDQASTPALNIFTKSQKIFGPAYQRPLTSEYGGEGISLTFHVDRAQKVKKFFEDWMHVIIKPERFTVGYQEEYTTSMLIRQLDEQERITNEIKLIEAFPRNMNIIELNNESSNQTVRLNMLFAYRYWVNTSRENTTPTAIPRAVQNPGIPTYDVNLPNIRTTITNRQWNWQTGVLDDAPGSDLPPSA